MSVLLPAAGTTAKIFAKETLPFPFVVRTSLALPPKILKLPMSPKLA